MTPPPDGLRAFSRSAAPLFALLAAASLLGLGVPSGSYVDKVLFDIGINIILAVSLNMVNGLTGQFSIGHAGFMALGAYASIVVTYYGGYAVFGDVDKHVTFAGYALFLASIVVGGSVASLAGFVVGLPSLRLRGDYLAIVTLGFGEIIRVLLQATPAVLEGGDMQTVSPLWRALHLGGALGFSHGQSYTSLVWTYAGVGVTLLVAYRLRESTHGRAFLSIRENDIAAESIGVDTTRYKVSAFVLAAFFAGVAGALFAHQLGAGTASRPEEFNFMKSFEAVIMVVLGGMGSISGAAVAAVALTLLTEGLRRFADYRLVAYSLLLILVMIWRPRGLLGTRELALATRWQGSPLVNALDVRQVSLSFGGLRAVSDFSLVVPNGALYGLIGPNGAGKTTVFNLLTGVYRPDVGEILIEGGSILGKKPHQICAQGAARTFQNIRLFGELSALDNVRVACHQRATTGMVAAVLRTGAFLREEQEVVERSRKLLALFGLEPYADTDARSLPYGQQRRLEIARALATAPKLLLLDEPAAGMNPQEKIELSALIRRVRDEFGCAILLIEHDMGLVMQVCERIAVLNYGIKIAEGAAAEVQADAKVIEAYLGTAHEAIA